VMDHVSGRVPESDADWRLVADYLGRVHGLTSGWPQRPRWSSSVDLVASESGTSVDLAAMPAEAVARCRKAWERLAGRPMTVVHGDPNAGNVRIEGDRVVLLDWDEWTSPCSTSYYQRTRPAFLTVTGRSRARHRAPGKPPCAGPQNPSTQLHASPKSTGSHKRRRYAAVAPCRHTGFGAVDRQGGDASSGTVAIGSYGARNCARLTRDAASPAA
jgi:hypothetical protein